MNSTVMEGPVDFMYLGTTQTERLAKMGVTEKSCYIAGPMRGYERWNFPAFDKAARLLRGRGWTVLSPAEHDRETGFSEYADDLDGFDLNAALAWDIEAIAKSECIVLLPGWEKSTGVGLELHAARVMGKVALVFDGSVLDWVRPLPPRRVGESAETGMETRVDGEVRVVNPDTGGEKGSKLARFDLLPAGPLTALAEHYGRGARKYEDRNWERGYEWSLSFAAMQRHAWAFWQGEDIDPETGSPHLAAVAWHAFTLLEFASTHPAMDNRPAVIA